MSSRRQADRCDLLQKSGCVDPLPSLRPSGRDMISSSNLLFPNPPDGMSSFGNVNREDVAQYARLVGRQLRSGKVALSLITRLQEVPILLWESPPVHKGKSGMGPASQRRRSGLPSRRVWFHPQPSLLSKYQVEAECLSRSETRVVILISCDCTLLFVIGLGG